MNQPSSNLSPESLCFVHLVALKYWLAGDMESNVALDALLLRWKEINWRDPGFIQFSEAMRTGMPTLTPKQEAALQPSLQAIVHILTEQLAAHSEDMASTLPALREAARNSAKVANYSAALIAFIEQIFETQIKMRDRLETLGDDVSAYALPDLPEPPQP
jgi:hypothetical protein